MPMEASSQGVPLGEYDGLMTTITTDSEYELAHYAHGVLYGLVRRYSASGALLASDYYINGESITPIKESAKTVDYYSLFYEGGRLCRKKPSSFRGQSLKNWSGRTAPSFSSGILPEMTMP